MISDFEGVDFAYDANGRKWGKMWTSTFPFTAVVVFDDGAPAVFVHSSSELKVINMNTRHCDLPTDSTRYDLL